jgi:HSP20 family protein|tara:strand:- start:6218 stop:6676 length:459 start_codon:yes stop_codon:yes gene_type:complete
LLQRIRPNTGRKDLDKLFENFFGTFTNPSASIWTQDPFGVRTTGSFPIDLKDEKDKMIVRADLPGMESDNLKVEVEDNILKIEANVEKSTESEGDGVDNYYFKERRVGSMQRSLTLPYKVDVKNTKSTYRDGVLEITLPKVEESQARQIVIE